MSITDNPIAVFLYAVKSPESKRQYPRRFKMFLDFLRLPGDLNSQAKEFLRNAKANPKWIEDNLIDFIAYQNERARQGDISVSTIPNYYRATKDDRTIMDYFYYSTRLFLKRNFKRRRWGDGNVVEIVLNSLRIPNFSRRAISKVIEDDKRSIRILMKEFYKHSPIQTTRLNIIESKMVQIQQEIDSIVYKCFNLTSMDIHEIENFIEEHSKKLLDHVEMV